MECVLENKYFACAHPLEIHQKYFNRIHYPLRWMYLYRYSFLLRSFFSSHAFDFALFPNTCLNVWRVAFSMQLTIRLRRDLFSPARSYTGTKIDFEKIKCEKNPPAKTITKLGLESNPIWLTLPFHFFSFHVFFFIHRLLSQSTCLLDAIYPCLFFPAFLLFPYFAYFIFDFFPIQSHPLPSHVTDSNEPKY